MTESVKERNVKAVQEWEKRANDVTREDELKKHETAVRNMKRCVQVGDKMEQKAFVTAREREGDKQHQMQLVEQIQTELSLLKKDNSKRMKEIAIQTKKVLFRIKYMCSPILFNCILQAEEDMSQRLLREQAKLRKSWHARDEQLAILQQERSRNLEDRYLLGEYQREQLRMARIAAVSQQQQQQVQQSE